MENEFIQTTFSLKRKNELVARTKCRGRQRRKFQPLELYLDYLERIKNLTKKQY
jgi:hypothetical protein